jgi:hypothetical protein
MIPSRKATLMFCVRSCRNFETFPTGPQRILDTQSMLLKFSLFYRLTSCAIFSNFQPSLRDRAEFFRNLFSPCQ